MSKGKLAKIEPSNYGKVPLTNRLDVPFELSFKYPLEKGFTFEILEKQGNKEFQNFLDKVSKMSIQQVDKSFRRPTDKNDTYHNKQILHYEVSKRFRIHVIPEDGRYIILRIDPNHNLHDK